MKTKESFVFYKSFYEAINKLPEEYQLELMKVIMIYNFEEELPKMSPVVEAMFTLIKANIDKASQRYEASVENGKKGGAPKGNDNAKKQPRNNLKTTQNNLNQPGLNLKQPRNNLNDNDNDNDNVNVNVNDNENENVDENENENATRLISSASASSSPSSSIFDFYLHNINAMPTPVEIEVLKDYMATTPEELIKYAIEKAVENNARSLAYIKAILNSWNKKGIRTLSAAKEEKLVKPTKAQSEPQVQKFHDNVKEPIDFSKYVANMQD